MGPADALRAEPAGPALPLAQQAVQPAPGATCLLEPGGQLLVHLPAGAQLEPELDEAEHHLSAGQAGATRQHLRLVQHIFTFPSAESHEAC